MRDVVWGLRATAPVSFRETPRGALPPWLYPDNAPGGLSNIVPRQIRLTCSNLSPAKMPEPSSKSDPIVAQLQEFTT